MSYLNSHIELIMAGNPQLALDQRMGKAIELSLEEVK